MKKILLSGGALLMGSAAASKLLGLFRDRLLVSTLPAEQLDRVFAAFRIPDFFFFLLIGGTVATLLLPRMAGLKGKYRTNFLSSFFWLVVTVFGVFCLIGALFPEFFIQIFASGFDSVARVEMATLVRWLFGSVWLLACSSVFGAAQQEQQKFLSVALAPVLYTGTICAGIWFGLREYGLIAIGIAAVGGAILHLFSNLIAYLISGGRFSWCWRKPEESFKNFGSDFSARVATNAAFQINLSADVWIASFLAAGAVSSYQIGTNLGMALLSMVGIPLASASFPKLTAAKGDKVMQKKVLQDSLSWVFLATIPAAIIGAVWAEFWLTFLFDASGELLRLGTWIFQIVVLSLPAACAIPVLSRIFLANDDVKTPLRVTIISLSIATAVAAFLALVILPKDIAVLGLGIGTFIANILSVLLFWFAIGKYFGTNIKYQLIANEKDIEVLKTKKSFFDNNEIRFSQDNIDFLKKNFTRKTSLYWKAVSQNNIVGVVFVDDEFWVPNSFFIREIFIDIAFRKKGIAKTFLERGISHAQNKGAKFIFTETAEWNIPFQNLCKKLGFEEWENPEWKEGITFRKKL